jgi:Cu/Ag efflux protein CusF
MIRTGIRAVVVPALASLVVAGGVVAQAAETEAGAQQETMGESHQGTMGQMAGGRAGAMGGEIQGTVKSFDKKTDLLTLSDGQELKVAPNATIVKNGKAASMKDLKKGDEVRASYAPTPMVHQITATSPAK